MSFYQFAVHLIKIIFRLFNGRPIVTGLENIPSNQPVIIAGTHRSQTDPFFIAEIVYPREVAFMAKSSLFKHKFLAKLLTAGKVFPVNRDKPSATSIKHAVKVLQDGTTLGIFPSGSRHTTEIKGGTAFIQKLSQAPIVPVAIQPPIGFWQFITRKKAKITFGTPIMYNPDIKYDKTVLAEIDQQIATQFEQLDAQIDPSYQYIPKKK
ncbi:1-acyl-sn-glycerol-3-phosphate acyltransferase [Aerococcaceae bacterium zg-ZUI334]|uniref:lysophospholipid acyltransferase family protein n=1 Tax=Aerococcaceae bacterium zg-252 TaxID=2796928 RepID=UPI001B90CB21|nr:1-acyl-sn-glycerol-3-phosphate acyltransferase [Aerococcaceae bacterium zg-ZUI334]